MATLQGQKIKSSYKDILQVSNSNSGIDATLRDVSDGEGTAGALQISTLGIKATGTMAYGSYSVAFGGNFSTGGTFSTAGNVSISGSTYTLAITLTGNTSITFPTSGTFITDTNVATLTNKTLTAPVIATISNTGTLTLPTSTDTLVGRATTDTLTNKTITDAVLIKSGNTVTLPAATDTLVGKATTDILTNKTLTSPKIGTSILDTNGNELVKVTATSSAVNEITLTNAATATSPTLSATGDDTNISINFQSKGTGQYNFLGTSTQQSRFVLYEQTSNGSNGIVVQAAASMAGDRTLQLPDTDISCFVVQRVSTIVTSSATGTTTIPLDDTNPQNTEGDQYMTLAITPKNSSNILRIDVIGMASNSAAATPALIMALFQDSTVGSLAVAFQTQVTSTAASNLKLTHIMSAGTTSSTTFKIRIGGSAAGTTTFNGQGGSRLFGGFSASSIVITEYSS